MTITDHAHGIVGKTVCKIFLGGGVVAGGRDGGRGVGVGGGSAKPSCISLQNYPSKQLPKIIYLLVQKISQCLGCH